MLRRLIERGNKKENVLSNHEIAVQVCESVLDLGYFGVAESNKPILKEKAAGAVKLPELLRYSNTTTQHFRSMLGIVNSPKDYRIKSWERGISHYDLGGEADILHRSESIGDTYIIADHYNSLYVNAFSSSARDVNMEVNLIGFKEGIWSLRYIYFHWGGATIFDSDFIDCHYNSSIKSRGRFSWFEPEKAFVLNYLMFPEPASAQDLLQFAGYGDKYLNYIQHAGRQKIGKFEITKYLFDSEGVRDMLNRNRVKYQDDRNPMFKPQDYEIYGLGQRKNNEFTVVKLGTVEIGNINYHIYSGSELPLLDDKVQEEATSVETNPSLAYVKVRP